MCIDNLII